MQDKKDLILNNIKDNRIKQAFLKIPREMFIPKRLRDMAYNDCALPIKGGQTISQLSLVLQMIELLNPQKNDVVLEIGTGSGYNAALLSLLVNKVYTIERINVLYKDAKKRFEKLNIKNVTPLRKNGVFGDVKHSPFDKIIITAATDKIPDKLIAQLKNNGIMLLPLGNAYIQSLVRCTKLKEKLKIEKFGFVNFVPLITR